MPTPFNTGIIIQARTGSKRLPGKMTLPFYGEMNLISLMINKLISGAENTPFVVATTTSVNDDVIYTICAEAGIPCYRGPEDDVLSRFTGAARQFGFQTIIRVCADNPFFDITSTLLLARILEESGADYAGFEMDGNLPSIKTHIGLWGEAVRLSALEKATASTPEMLYREHVTNFVYGHPGLFTIKLLPAPYGLGKRTDLRFTLDTREDLELHREIYKKLASTDSINNIEYLVKMVDENPRYRKVMQKQIILNSK